MYIKTSYNYAQIYTFVFNFKYLHRFLKAVQQFDNIASFAYKKNCVRTRLYWMFDCELDYQIGQNIITNVTCSVGDSRGFPGLVERTLDPV